MKNYIILLVMLLSCNTPPQPTPEVKTPVVAKTFYFNRLQRCDS